MKLNRLILVASAFFLFIPVKSFAVHKGAGALVCGQCHTMHNSQGRAALNTNSNTDSTAMILLRGNVNNRAEIHKLCLQCHATNGQWATEKFAPRNVQAPKVFSDAPWNHLTDSFDKIGSAGNFFDELSSAWDTVTPNALGKGHSLGQTDAVPPGADSQTQISLTCTNCHDPHGTDDPDDLNINIFRNLRVKPLGSGDFVVNGLPTPGVKFLTDDAEYYKMKSFVGGVSVSSVNGAYFGGDEKDRGNNTIWPIFTERYGALTGNPVTDNGKTNSYATGLDSEKYYKTMSKWCAQCHDKWHEAVVPSNKKHDFNPIDSSGNPIASQYALELDSRRHMVNSMVPRAAAKGCANGCHHSLLDRSNYNTDLIVAGKGIPVTSSDFYAGNVYYLPKCDEAGNPSCLGMDHVGTPSNTKVFCFTCHFAHGGPNYDNLRWNYNADVREGFQMGNVIESNVGCQLCHNR